MSAGMSEPLEGGFYIQSNAAYGDGRINAVQHGDQYNYIYLDTPPYRVEPFPFTAPGVIPAGLERVPSRLLSASHQVVPFVPRPQLAVLEEWRDDPTPGLSVHLLHAEGGSGKTRPAAEFAATSAQAGWTAAVARHRSEAASPGGEDDSLTVRAPGLVLIVDYAERWPRSDLVALVEQHRRAARDRLRILLLSRCTGVRWQDLIHQFGNLQLFDTRTTALPAAASVRGEM